MGEIEFSFVLENENEVMQSFGALSQAIGENEALQLWVDLEDLLVIIQQEYVPVDTGELRDSGYVREPVETSDGWIVEIGFAAEHAWIQHERLDYNHTHGQAKYVEVPLMQFLDARVK